MWFTGNISEGCRCVAQPQTHHPELKGAQGSVDSCFGYTKILDTYMVIPGVQLEFSEVSTVLNKIKLVNHV